MLRLLSVFVCALVMLAGCYQSEYRLDAKYNRPTQFDGSAPSNPFPYYWPYPTTRHASNTSTSHAGIGGQR